MQAIQATSRTSAQTLLASCPGMLHRKIHVTNQIRSTGGLGKENKDEKAQKDSSERCKTEEYAMTSVYQLYLAWSDPRCPPGRDQYQVHSRQSRRSWLKQGRIECNCARCCTNRKRSSPNETRRLAGVVLGLGVRGFVGVLTLAVSSNTCVSWSCA